MRRVLILVAISFLLCSTANAQGGGGESTKKGSNKKKVVTKKQDSGIKSNSTTPPRRPSPPSAQGLSIDLGHDVKLELVMIRPGTFQMGSDNDDKRPVDLVTISQPFYLGKYEVTQAQWQAIMNNNPSGFQDCGGNCPVESVSWDDAQDFIKRLNARGDGQTYRLPTEAEWEYAARASTPADYIGSLDEMAWYLDNSSSATHPVGQKKPNAWGLYDMYGNVSEWCQDWWDRFYKRTGPSSDPTGPSSGYTRVLRGGSWRVPASNLRFANLVTAPGTRYNYVGFRLVAVVGIG
jgi:formylglycine-generating enzyme required for sulfatase activity